MRLGCQLPASGANMKAKTILLASALASISGIAQAQMAQADVPTRKIANQYICTFNASVGRDSVEAETGKAVGRALGEVLHTYKNTIRGFAVRMPAMPDRSPVSELRANNPRIADCEQDQEVKAVVQGQGRGKPGGGGGSGQQVTDWGVARVGGPGSPVSGRRAWIIDTGIEFTHPDLNVDQARSRTYVGGTPNDENGHGTHVAGTIAAKDNNIGVVGVSPGSPVVSVRVLNRQGSGTTSGVIAGVDYVASAAASGDVANMSLGGGASASLDAAVVKAAAKGIKFALAAGNESDDANNHSPARAEGDNIYTVSAMSSSGALASFSNYGNPPVDYAAPGVSIKSTYKGGGYATLSGTSMAAPHVAGILMLGNVKSDGTVTGDPDGNPDPIAHR